jgi:hypothetical protein
MHWNWTLTLANIALWSAALLNLISARAAVRDSRLNRALRQIIWAYEKDLIERGVRLPPRCVFCCQILPRHVEGCEFEDVYAEHHRMMGRLTRPPITYYPKGEKPPEVRGH